MIISLIDHLGVKVSSPVGIVCLIDHLGVKVSSPWELFV